MTYTLSFEVGPDHVETGSPADTTTSAVSIGPSSGALTSLGTYTSLAESGNDGVREWLAFSVDVTALFDPTVAMAVDFAYSSGNDASHWRRVKVTGPDGVLFPEYPQGAVYTQDEIDGVGLPVGQMGEQGGGGAAATEWSASTDSVVTGGGAGGCARWYFSGPGGWLVGAVAIG